ncbi:site-2 protease family protein [Patescibacteria group bacterium]|nr:site-2 protease family protein [Patescibacteria group bacterium]
MFLSIYYLLALVLILTVHEFAHAWVALRLGDPTAERAGRVSLNPLKHLDLLGTLMLFLVGIGWGKPVPVNPRNFKNPVRDGALTAFAGPLANLILAFMAAFPLSYLPETSATAPWLVFFGAVMDLSLVLFFFNMLPFPPLDGSKFVSVFVPVRYRASYMEFLRTAMPYFLVFVVVDIYLSPYIFGASIVWTVVSTATFWLKTAILLIV